MIFSFRRILQSSHKKGMLLLLSSFKTKRITSVIMKRISKVNASRPPSQMLVGAPGMASDYLNRQPSVYDVEPTVSPPETEEEILKPAKDIVYFDALSLLSVFQVAPLIFLELS